ncbi:MAG: sensor histidine kinase [Chitinophagaceae bacterium]
MIQKPNTWKLLMSILAVAIVIGTFFYSNYLSTRIAEREKRQMEEWVAAQQKIANAEIGEDLSLASIIIAEQTTIPVIEANETDSIMGFMNLDSNKATNNNYLASKLNAFKNKGNFIKTYIDTSQKKFNVYYYGESSLLIQVRYFPLLQLLIVILFTTMMIISINNRNKSIQNQLWAGLAKETAHQLGTPISALSGWTTILKEGASTHEILPEMEKDIDRLKLISERFSMIGGTPKKENVVLQELVENVVTYMKKRASEKVTFIFNDYPAHSVQIALAPELIEWVIENICKNGLDAMSGTGTLTLAIHELNQEIYLDISDTGKGIPASLQTEIFNPGISTKKRGWGVGLTLAKRIVEEYHRGQLFILQSAEGKGTTFRIAFKK